MPIPARFILTAESAYSLSASLASSARCCFILTAESAYSLSPVAARCRKLRRMLGYMVMQTGESLAPFLAELLQG